MPSLVSRILPFYFRATRANRIFASGEAAEQHIAARRLHPRPHKPPFSLRHDVTVVPRTKNGWPVYTLTPRTGSAVGTGSPAGTGSPVGTASPVGSVLYLHGGAWVNEVALQHWQLTAQIAVESNTTVILPIYPVVPVGTALEVNAGVVRLALAARLEHGSFSLAGDSAGGQIALSAAATLRDEHQVTPTLTVLISPAIDPSMKNPDMDVVQPTDPWLAKPGNVVFIDAWRGELSVDDPRINALTADLAGLGPILMFSGTRDILNPDARLLAAKATAAGVAVEYHEQPGLVHVYPLTPTPEGRSARALIVSRLRASD